MAQHSTRIRKAVANIDRPFTARALARLLKMRHQRVTVTLRYMEKQGIIERVGREVTGKKGQPRTIFQRIQN